DSQIAGIQQEIDIRKLDNDIIKDHAIIAGAANRTDQDLATQAALLTTAIGNSVADIGKFQSAAFLTAYATLNLGVAANKAADALNGVGGADIPSYAMGTDYVPRTGLALLHRGEQVL